MTGSRNATTWERVNKFIGNKIELRYGDNKDQVSDELGIKWHMEREMTIHGLSDKIRGMHGGHHGHPGPADDY